MHLFDAEAGDIFHFEKKNLILFVFYVDLLITTYI
jgi:hypothetical protein